MFACEHISEHNLHRGAQGRQLGRDGEPEVCLDRIPSLRRVGEQMYVHLIRTVSSALTP
jgi:hypothetical protein